MRDDDERVDAEVLHDVMLEIAMALEERFGDVEPSDEDVRAFLVDRLVSEGRTPEEARRLVDELQQP